MFGRRRPDAKQTCPVRSMAEMHAPGSNHWSPMWSPRTACSKSVGNLRTSGACYRVLADRAILRVVPHRWSLQSGRLGRCKAALLSTSNTDTPAIALLARTSPHRKRSTLDRNKVKERGGPLLTPLETAVFTIGPSELPLRTRTLTGSICNTP